MDSYWFNGVNATTGKYLHCPSFLEIQKSASLLRKDGALTERLASKASPPEEVVVRPGIDARDLERTGWCVLFGSEVSDTIIEKMRPLLEYRCREVTGKTRNRDLHPLYRELRADRRLITADDAIRFLDDHGAVPGPVTPTVLPYYILIVASPESISFEFQCVLDVDYAVGRLHFESPSEYVNYAKAVEDHESRIRRVRSVFFTPTSPGDHATELSDQHLGRPIVASTQTGCPGALIQLFSAQAATKERLLGVFDDPPDFLFSASHGVAFHRDDPKWATRQGALLCADWPGPDHSGALSEDWYVSSADISPGIDLRGLISFHFACYSAGTPTYDEFDYLRGLQPPDEIAPFATVSKLAEKMLARGALAFVGHVERAWTCSFVSPVGQRRPEAFEDAVRLILQGHRVGEAIESFNLRFASVATRLTAMTQRFPVGVMPSQQDQWLMTMLWMMHNDLRNYMVVGDPAVRLRIATA